MYNYGYLDIVHRMENYNILILMYILQIFISLNFLTYFSEQSLCNVWALWGGHYTLLCLDETPLPLHRSCLSNLLHCNFRLNLFCFVLLQINMIWYKREIDILEFPKYNKKLKLLCSLCCNLLVKKMKNFFLFHIQVFQFLKSVSCGFNNVQQYFSAGSLSALAT